LINANEHRELAQRGAMMSQSGTNEVISTGRSDLVDQAVIVQFMGKVEPGGEVTLATVLGTVAFSLLVVFGTTAWWMLH
jgi:hypothetical protein